ncbi:MAG: mitochondrial fission ELM1 family protein [Phycisphaeraceae bacterium]
MATPTLYIVSDGKPGHLAQSQGLAEAIQRAIRARVIVINAEGKREAPQPEKEAGLIIAAGHTTHAMAYALRRYLGLPAIVLMNPGWIGRQRFDLSIIPKHDMVRPSPNVIVTEGALNRMTAAQNASPDHGLIMVGGPSKHHGWDNDKLEQQLNALIEKQDDVTWTVTSSRRTPDSTDTLLKSLAKSHGDRFEYTPADQTPDGWVAEQLDRCGVCWVSEDSVSMVYESLTAGAQVGLIDAPRKGSLGRVVRGVDSLIERGWVLPFDTWDQGQALPTDRPTLAEADRVASLIIERCLKSTTPA